MFIKKILPLILLGAVACIETDPTYLDEQLHIGYVPVYGSTESSEIAFEAPRTVSAPGKIYVYDNYLFINENNQGIHIYNNADPAHPQALGFIRILGNYDMAVKNGILYAGHLGTVTAIQLNSFTDLQVKSTLSVDDFNYGVPPPAGAYFECPETSKGVVVSWKAVDKRKFDCYALY